MDRLWAYDVMLLKHSFPRLHKAFVTELAMPYGHKVSFKNYNKEVF